MEMKLKIAYNIEIIKLKIQYESQRQKNKFAPVDLHYPVI